MLARGTYRQEGRRKRELSMEEGGERSAGLRLDHLSPSAPRTPPLATNTQTKTKAYIVTRFSLCVSVCWPYTSIGHTWGAGAGQFHYGIQMSWVVEVEETQTTDKNIHNNYGKEAAWSSFIKVVKTPVLSDALVLTQGHVSLGRIRSRLPLYFAYFNCKKKRNERTANCKDIF